MDSRIKSCYFIGNPEKSKGYRFYIPQCQIPIQETHNAMFLEDQDILDLSRENFVFKEIDQNNENPAQANYNQILLFPQPMSTSIDDLTA